MTRLNHERPIFKLLADLKRDKNRPLPEGLTKLEKKFASVSGSGRSPARTTRSHEKKVIHEVAVEIFDRVARNNDVRIINLLLEAVDKEAEKNAVLEWFCRYGRVTSVAGKLKFSKDKHADRTAAVANPYWMLILKPSQNRAAFNLSRELEKLVGKATERMARPSSGDEIDPTLLAAVKRVLRG